MPHVRRALCVLLLAAFQRAGAVLPSSPPPLAPGSDAAGNVAFHSPAGQAILQRTTTMEAAYYPLAEAYVSQVTQTFCSLATATILLNALNQTAGLPTPTADIYSPYPFFTQEDVFASPCVQALTTHTGVPFSAAFLAAHGATLNEWNAYLSCFASVTATHASASTPAALRAQLQAAFSATPPRFVGANYHRSGVGQAGGGHMSPLAAYDPVGDLVLILDVARYRASVYTGFGPIWAPLQSVFNAMNTTDSDSGASRGWVEVHAPSSPSSLPPAGPLPPAFNFTISRLCLSALPNANDVWAVERCMSSNPPAAPSPPPPPCALPPAPGASGGSPALAVVTVLFALAAAGGAVAFMRERRLRRAGTRVGATAEHLFRGDGAELLPR